MTCPECHGDTIDGNGDLCGRCNGTGELEPQGESVAVRVARERVLQGTEPHFTVGQEQPVYAFDAEIVKARAAAAKRRLQGEPWPGGDEAGDDA